MSDKTNNTDNSTTVGSQAASDLVQQDRHEPLPAEKPSQAEGDRETIEEDIQQKEQSGEL